jgi:uncharacterized protein (DUF952 family)
MDCVLKPGEAAAGRLNRNHVSRNDKRCRLERVQSRRYRLAINQGSRPVATIYKICEVSLWRAAEAAGQFRGSPVDESDGFIHFSTAAQLAETAAKHFAGQSALVLVAVETDRLGGELKWERSRGGDLFPHLYAALPLNAVRWARPLPDEADGRRPLPELEP